MCCAWNTTVTAKVASVTVGEIRIKTETEEVNEQVSGICELWNTLLTGKLSEFESISILEREYLSDILKELELSLTDLSDPNFRIQTQKLLGVDFLVLSEMTVAQSLYRLSCRLVNVGDGSVEREFNVNIDLNTIDEQVDNFANKIKESVINYFNSGDITHLIAVVDFENKSPLNRNNWMEFSVPRKLRRALKVLPHVRILEREEVDLLLQEVRLFKGGFVRKEEGLADNNDNQKKRFLITGSYDESQPLGQKARLEFLIKVRELDSRKEATYKTDFTIGEFNTGLTNIKNLIVKRLFMADAGAKSPNIIQPEEKKNNDEAIIHLDGVARLMGFDSIEDLGDVLWWIRSYEFFSQSRHSSDASAYRRANINRAVRYLKTAIMLDDNNVRAKELLAVLLVDKQIADLSFAVELAQETAARYPDSIHQRDASLFLVRHLNIVRGKPYLNLLIESYPRSYSAQSAIAQTCISLVKQENIPLIERIEKCKKYMQKALEWQSDRWFVEAQMQTWFKLTQNSAEYADFGEKHIDRMIEDFPQAAIRICTYWAYHWDYLKKNRSKTIYWCRRGLELLDENDELKKQLEVEKDRLGFMLGHNLFREEQYQLAFDALKNCNYLYKKDAPFIQAMCLFEMGQYEEALAGFEKLGKYGVYDYGSAWKWAQKCREKTQITRKMTWNEGTGTWAQPDIPLPKSYISALTSDGKDIWIGTIHPHATFFANGHNMVMLERDPKSMEEAKQTGGLIRYNPETKQAAQFEVGKEISSLWITDIHATRKCVWVGTYDEGLDVYDKQTSIWSNISESNGLPSNYIQCLASDDSYLWIGTGHFGKGAVARLDLNTNEIHTFLPRNFTAQSPPPTCYIHDIESVGNKLWCALGRNGVAMYDKETKLWTTFSTHTVKQSFHALERIAIFDDRVWFGGSQGNRAIYSCKINGTDWQSISSKDRLPPGGNVFVGIFATEPYNDRLLLGTYGLMVMDVDGNFTTYKLRSGYAVTKLLPLPSEVWIGTRQGLVVLKNP
jgi:tetratricopeptide (TPR) repeat protein